MATKDLETTQDPATTGDNDVSASNSSSKKRKTTITEIEVDLNQPEPPSKKARRALKKGKTLPAKPQSGDEGDDDNNNNEAEGGGGGKKTSDESKDGKKKERSPYGVWIGNLRFTVTKNDLRKWFVENSGGAITDELITRVNLPTTKPVNGGPGPKKAAENRGFAYVDFATFEANVAAIALSETEWNGRKVLIKDSKSFEGRPKKEESATTAEAGAGANSKPGDERAGVKGAADAKKKNPSTKIFVGNLSFTTTEGDLHAHFEKCGKIRWVKVATFEDTGKCKGYGWVNFEEPEAAQWAVKGFVKVRETIDTLEDFMEEEDGDAGSKQEAKEDGKGEKEDGDDDNNNDDDAKTPTKSKKEKEPPRIKTRKWWVNQLLGRNLKIELAEDDQLRYAKRFKKGGQRNKEGGGGGNHQRQQDGGERGEKTNRDKDYPVREKKQQSTGPAYANDIAVARLTGAAVAPQGKKTTFD